MLDPMPSTKPHRMRLAKVSPRYAKRHNLNPNHHARVWCDCMDDPINPPGFSPWGSHTPDRHPDESLADPRRLGAFDHLAVIDMRETDSAINAYRAHLAESDTLKDTA